MLNDYKEFKEFRDAAGKQQEMLNKIDYLTTQWIADNVMATMKLQEQITEVLKEVKEYFSEHPSKYYNFDIFCKYAANLEIRSAIDTQADFMKHKLITETIRSITDKSEEA